MKDGAAPLTHTLDNGTAMGSNATVREPISPDGTPEPDRTYEVPPRQGRAVRVRSGQTLRIINVHGTQVCDLWIFSAENPHEFLSLEHARVHLEKIIPQVGDPLLTNHRRPIAEFVADTSPGAHDTLMAACDLFRYRNLGVEGYHDNCADNLRMAMRAIGLTPHEVPQPFNLWMNVPIRRDYTIEWRGAASKAGDFVDLKAALDCVVVMSACPQDLTPVNGHNPRELAFRLLA